MLSTYRKDICSSWYMKHIVGFTTTYNVLQYVLDEINYELWGKVYQQHPQNAEELYNAT